MCRRHANIGWVRKMPRKRDTTPSSTYLTPQQVYRCTQDDNGFLPESEFVHLSPDNDSTMINEESSAWELSPWIEQAAVEGHYTMVQYQILLKQRQGVRNAIFAQLHATSPSPSTSSNDSMMTHDAASTTMTSIASHPEDSPPRLQTQVPSEYESSHLRGIPHVDEIKLDYEALSDDIHTSYDGAATSMPASTVTSSNALPIVCVPKCAWKCCQTCRPTYRDRALQSINAIMDQPYQEPPEWELQNRRISDARIAAQIGLPKPRPSHLASSEYSGFSSDSNTADSEATRAWNGPSGAPTSKSGFRASVKNTMKGVIGHTWNDSQTGEGAVKKSSRDSLKRISRSMMFRKDTGQPKLGKGAKVVEDGQLQDSLMYLIACQTPLPIAGAEELEYKEVEGLDKDITEDGGFYVADAGIMTRV